MFTIQLSTRMIIVGGLVVSALLVASYPLHGVAIISYFAMIVIGLSMIGYLFFRTGPDVRHSVEGLSALFTVLALFSAAYWYFFERPGVPKLELKTDVEVWPVEKRKALVRMVVEMKNVGSTKVEFGKDFMGDIALEQVLPLAPAELEQAAPGQPVPFQQVDGWRPELARGKARLEGLIEAGENERLYFRAIVPCRNGMILSGRIHIPKVYNTTDKMMGRADNRFHWVSEGVSKAVPACKG